MTHYDPNRPDPYRDPRDLPGARRSDDPLNPPLNPPEPVIHDSAPILTESEARQAPKGRPVLMVLLAGLVLALVAWGVAELYPRGGNRLADTNAGEPRTTGTTQQPTAGGIPLSPPKGSPEGSATQGQTGPDSAGRGQTSAPSPSSDSAR